MTQGKGGPTPLAIVVPDGQEFSLGGPIKSPHPDVKFDENFSIEVEQHEEKADFVVPISVAPGARPGKRTLRVDARYQACTARLCLPPQTEKLEVPITVSPGGRGAE